MRISDWSSDVCSSDLVVQSAPPVIQTVPPQTPGATPIVPGPLGQELPPVVQPAPMAVEPAVPSPSATIGHTAAISLPEHASPPPLLGEPVPFPQALPAPTREPMAIDQAEEHLLRPAQSSIPHACFR